jgi:hypothetical protein
MLQRSRPDSAMLAYLTFNDPRSSNHSFSPCATKESTLGNRLVLIETGLLACPVWKKEMVHQP